MRLLKFTSIFTLTAVLAACGGSQGVFVASSTASPPSLPATSAFAVTNVVEPAASTSATSLTLPLPPSPGYGGRAIFPVPSVPPGLRLTITYTNYAPSGVPALSALRQQLSTRRAALDASSTTVVYACFAANYVVDIPGKPQFSFTLPAGFATNSVAYNLAIEQGGKWTTGYGGPGTIVATATSATVAATGRFGFTIPANGSVCVALYGRSTSASTPVPATPGPSASPTPSASAHPTAPPTVAPSAGPTLTPRPTPTPVPSARPSAMPTPTATPTPTPTPSFSPASLSILGLGSTYAQSTSVLEPGYSGALSIDATACAGIATISPGSGSGPSLALTVTGQAAGSCTATATDSSAHTATLNVTVTTSTIGVNAKSRKP